MGRNSQSKKNPLTSSLKQKQTGKTVTATSYTSPFSSVYGTAGILSINQTEEEYRQVLASIRDSKKDMVVAGIRNTDVSQAYTEAEDVELVDGNPETDSNHEDDSV